MEDRSAMYIIRTRNTLFIYYKFDGFVILCVEYDPHDTKKTVFMQNLNLDFFL